MHDLLFDDEPDRSEEEGGFFIAQESVAVDNISSHPPTSLYGMVDHTQQFLKMINDDHVPQALIFYGPQGIGKFSMAMKLARTLLAQPSSVDKSVDNHPGLFGDQDQQVIKLSTLDLSPHHPVAQRVAAGAHPDLLVIGADDSEQSKSGHILIDQARLVPRFLQLKPSQDGGVRVVIIDNANRLNRNAQNALLKILEEPPARTVLILITHQLGQLLPTIRSRAQEVRFTPLNDQDFDSWMKQELTKTGRALALSDLKWIRQLSKNCPGTAQKLIDIEAVRVIESFLPLWHNWPELDENIWFKFSEMVAGGDDAVFNFALDFWQWWLDALIQAKVNPVFATELLTLLSGPETVRLMESISLHDLITRRDRVVKLFERMHHAALEKRQVIFSARLFMMGTE